MYSPKSHALANLSLGVLSILPMFIKVNPNFNVIATSCLTVFIGSYRSVKKTSPAETMSKEHAMSFPFIGSAVLFGLFLLFKFLSKDLINTVLTFYFVFLGVLALTATLLPFFSLFCPKSWSENVIHYSIPHLKSLGDIEFTLAHIVSGIPSFAFCLFYLFKKHWFANNVLGLAFAIQGIEMLSLGSFTIGAILLVGLFFYDIFWVFCTPVMVSVAKSFEAPIKLLFPTRDITRPFSMLGLGDIVIPGIFLALALRFDMSREIKKPKYFYSALYGYFFGIVTTIFVMNYFQAAQPALLYIVPGVLGFIAIHAFVTGEIKQLLAYDESIKKLNEKVENQNPQTADVTATSDVQTAAESKKEQ